MIKIENIPTWVKALVLMLGMYFFAVGSHLAHCDPSPGPSKFMTHSQIKKEALSKEKAKPKQMFVPYVPLSDMIPEHELKRLDDKKKLKALKDHSCLEKPSLWDVFFPKAFAMGCSRVKPEPQPSVTPEPSASPSAAVTPIPSITPSPTPSAAPSAVPGVDLRACDTPIKTQVGPLCTAWGSASAIENLRCKGGDISEKHIWSFYKQYSSEAAVNATSAPGRWITLERYWPGENANPYAGYLDVKNTKVRAVSWRYLDDSLAEVMKELDKKHPVKIAHSVSSDEANCRSVIRWDPSVNSDTGGGHDVTVVGYQLDSDFKGGGYLILKNSWGGGTSGCGDLGYQYMSFGYCERQGSYCQFWALSQIEER